VGSGFLTPFFLLTSGSYGIIPSRDAEKVGENASLCPLYILAIWQDMHATHIAKAYG
jgi:hypothetical protein